MRHLEGSHLPPAEDCIETNVVDTVVYGDMGSNSDNWEDDCGDLVANLPGNGFGGDSLARDPNGVDTNDMGADFVSRSDGDITMGSANP